MSPYPLKVAMLHLTLVGLFRAWKFEKRAHLKVSAYGSILSYLNLVVYQGCSMLLRIYDGLLSTGNSIKTALWLTQNKSNNSDILQLTVRGNAGATFKATEPVRASVQCHRYEDLSETQPCL